MVLRTIYEDNVKKQSYQNKVYTTKDRYISYSLANNRKNAHARRQNSRNMHPKQMRNDKKSLQVSREWGTHRK